MGWKLSKSGPTAGCLPMLALFVPEAQFYCSWTPSDDQLPIVDLGSLILQLLGVNKRKSL
ncbi:hypothetical protein Plhal304r1_c006g0026631 [Plasmopara halstedii]